MRSLWRRSPASRPTDPYIWHIAVNIIQFWDNPISGSDFLPPILSARRHMQKSLKSAEYARLIATLVAVRHALRRSPAGAGQETRPAAVFYCQVRGWRAPHRCRRIYCDCPALWAPIRSSYFGISWPESPPRPGAKRPPANVRAFGSRAIFQCSRRSMPRIRDRTAQ